MRVRVRVRVRVRIRVSVRVRVRVRVRDRVRVSYHFEARLVAASVKATSGKAVFPLAAADLKALVARLGWG